MPTLQPDGTLDAPASQVGERAGRVRRSPPLDVAGELSARTLRGILVTERQPNIRELVGRVFINESDNANMTEGLTINQGDNDDQVLALKSSDVATGLTTGIGVNVETDDFFTLQKRNAVGGGALLIAVNEDAGDIVVFNLISIGGTANTTKSTAGRGLFEIFVGEHNGSNALANVTADGNVFAIRCRIGGVDRTVMIVDEDGDLFADSGTSTTAVTVFDKHEDAELIRAFDIARAPADLIRSEWDEQLRYGEEDLIAAGILGAPIADGGLINITQLQRLHNGAIWQGHCERQELRRENVELRARLERVERLLPA